VGVLAHPQWRKRMPFHVPVALPVAIGAIAPRGRGIAGATSAIAQIPAVLFPEMMAIQSLSGCSGTFDIL
jgi:hypothetical protein